MGNTISLIVAHFAEEFPVSSSEKFIMLAKVMNYLIFLEGNKSGHNSIEFEVRSLKLKRAVKEGQITEIRIQNDLKLVDNERGKVVNEAE